VAGLIGTLHTGSRCCRLRPKATCESCVKTSTCRGEKKGGKGTQRLPQCQALTRIRPSERSFAGAVDNPRCTGIDSPSFRVARAENNSSWVGRTIRGRNRAGFVMAPLSCSPRGGTSGGPVQHLDPAAAGCRGRPHLAPARPEPLRGRLGERERRRPYFRA